MLYDYIGKNTPIHDALPKATGEIKYCGDLEFRDMLHMNLLLSPIAHGIVTKIDTTLAEALPGVVRVLTYENTPNTLYNRGRIMHSDELVDQESLFTNHVRFVGDRIGAVIAESQEIAAQACSLIKLEIQPLTAILSLDEAMDNTQVKLHDENNCISLENRGYGDFANANGEEILCQTNMQRVSHLAMETHIAVAEYSSWEDKITIWTPCQSVFGVRANIAMLMNMPMNKIRVIKTTMGGSFGGKQEVILEPLAAYGAKVCKRRVKLAFNRQETILCTMLKHPILAQTSLKFNQDGILQGAKLNCYLDSGAYQSVSPTYARAMYYKLSRVYQIPNLNYNAFCICTNSPVSGSFRGWSSPETTLIIENNMNKAAKELGIDPIALRLKNIIKPNTINAIENYSMGASYLEDCLIKGRDAFDWERKKKEISRQNKESRYLRGIGMALGSHYCGFYPRKAESGAVLIKMQEDGSLNVNICLHDHGCGTVTVIKNIIAEELSINPERITIGEGDTQHNLYDFGCYSSRTTYIMGRAAQLCAGELLNKLKEKASLMLGVPLSHICKKGESLFPEDKPESVVTYSDIALYSLKTREEDIFATYEYSPSTNPGVGAAHFAEVEVDTYTGFIKVIDYLAVHDIGKALNPSMCEAQIGGAVQQGMGIAFSEIVRLDPKTGKALDTSLKRYDTVNSYDMPKIKVLFIEEADASGPFGGKSIGEVAMVPVAPALVEAVNNALGTDIYTLPINPPAVLDAIAKRRAENEN